MSGTPPNVAQGTDPKAISTVVFEQQAAMRARLQAKYLNVNDSNPGWKPITFGSFTGVGGLVKVSLQLEGIPDGSLICFGADCSGAADRWDNTYYVVKYDGSVKEYPQFKLTGSAFQTWFVLKGWYPLQ